MASVKTWLSAFRLRTLPLSVSGIIVGSAVAFQQGYGNVLILVLALLTTLFLQILSNLANDLGDTLKGADNENRVGPMRAVQSGEISAVQMKNAVIGFALLSFITAVPLILIGTQQMPSVMLWTYFFLAIACVIAAITYTVGKKAYGYSGLGDVFVFIFFGFVSVLGVYSLYAKKFDVSLLLLATTIGLLSTAVLNLNNMRDHENDAQVGKNTLVVQLGFTNAKKYHTALIIGACISYLVYAVIHFNPWSGIGLIPFILLFKHLAYVWKTDIPKNLDPELKKVALSTFFIALLFTVSTLL